MLVAIYISWRPPWHVLAELCRATSSQIANSNPCRINPDLIFLYPSQVLRTQSGLPPCSKWIKLILNLRLYEYIQSINTFGLFTRTSTYKWYCLYSFKTRCLSLPCRPEHYHQNHMLWSETETIWVPLQHHDTTRDKLYYSYSFPLCWALGFSETFYSKQPAWTRPARTGLPRNDQE